MKPATLVALARLQATLLKAARRDRFAPPKVTAILTEHCHLHCQFCHLWNDPREGAPLEDWLRFFASNRHLCWVNLSGGEVFVKSRFEDLLDGLVGALPELALLDFPTAGQRPDTILCIVEKLLCTRLPLLSVTVSIDGGPAIHDRLRGVDGAFERALETYSRLREIGNSRFVTRVGCTLTAHAREQVDSLTTALKDRLRGFSDQELHFNLAHHSSHYYKNGGFDDLPGEDALRILEERRNSWSPIGWIEWTYSRLARRALAEGFPPMGCVAIDKTVFVAPDLTVHPCSIWDRPLGNLRDHAYSLSRLLERDEARAARAEVDRRLCPGCMTPCEAVPALLARPIFSTIQALRARHASSRASLPASVAAS